MAYNIQELLSEMVKRGASDLHITAGSPPLIRLSGRLTPIGTDKLKPDETMRMTYSLMNEMQKKAFEQTKECDFSFGIANLARFRANAYLQRGCVAIALRIIPLEIKTFKDLGLPSIMGEFTTRPSGLVLVTGATGSGKSTTLAAMIDKINKERHDHILTVEDPIEFLHKHQGCMINQREVGSDTMSFSQALKMALRQDPDVVLIGEMRDLETIRAALTIAETGHLTFATLHTNSAVQTVNRIVDAFPKGEQQTIRTQLSFVLQGVICQTLLPKIGGGRVMCYEVMNCTPGIRALIRDDKVHQIESMIEIGQKFGMNTMNMRLCELIAERKVDRFDGIAKSPNPDQLEKLLMEKGL
ncbi:MAG: type IV pilus twitching motility protein PilT [Fibrobacteraceae bacterium]|jgi:twitching motility protein PilT|nr:type IV pilus twitching motility protein PilT [Fibrobacteraceae bacterium]MBQ5611190.1 type IV pilus twitching motility protein PilT [Fibrobacteraceae bacterium]MEE1275953.1 type IV pilus twitching motility protein PilT [Fibrobacteraceae bacterium]